MAVTVIITLGFYIIMVLFIMGILKVGKKEQDIQDAQDEEYNKNI